jgi:hypothetical protein
MIVGSLVNKITRIFWKDDTNFWHELHELNITDEQFSFGLLSKGIFTSKKTLSENLIRVTRD